MKIKDKSLIFFLILEVFLVVILFSLFPSKVSAGVGVNNVTVITYLDIGNVYPELFNVTVQNNASSIVLIPNSTRKVFCSGIAVDYNGWNDLSHASAVFFDYSNSTYSSLDDNNLHYTNSSCTIVSEGTYSALVNCTFDIWYYANPGKWNCTIKVNDSFNKAGYGSDDISISSLLGLGLPDYIHYGTVNATEYSFENASQVTNYGNVKINLSLSGYGFQPNDGNAMNCTLGTIKNISILHEKYNLTQSNPVISSFDDLLKNYVNLTSSPVVKRFELEYRQNDIVNEAIKPTYWRIYVPLGVGGTCQGNIVFGATVSPEN